MIGAILVYIGLMCVAVLSLYLSYKRDEARMHRERMELIEQWKRECSGD